MGNTASSKPSLDEHLDHFSNNSIEPDGHTETSFIPTCIPIAEPGVKESDTHSDTTSDEHCSKCTDTSAERIHNGPDIPISNTRKDSMTHMNEQPVQLKNAEYLDLVIIEQQELDLNECDTCACAVTGDGQFLLIDHNNDTLRILDQNFTSSEFYKQTHVHIFEYRPWGIAVFPVNEPSMLAITFPFSRLISIFELNDVNVEPRDIHLSEQCYGIASLNDGFVITTRCIDGDGHFVVFLNKDWTEICRVDLSQMDDQSLLNPVSITTPRSFVTVRQSSNSIAGQTPETDTNSLQDEQIYICCQGSPRINGCVVAMTTRGEVLRTYTDQRMKGCTGCDLDAAGNLYVCGYRSSTVHVFDVDGTGSQVILSGDGKNKTNQPSQIVMQQGNLFVLAEPYAIKLFMLLPL